MVYPYFAHHGYIWPNSYFTQLGLGYPFYLFRHWSYFPKLIATVDGIARLVDFKTECNCSRMAPRSAILSPSWFMLKIAGYFLGILLFS
jgi:hypothetical protein